MADSVSVLGGRSAVPGSLHCDGGKSSGGGGFVSCGMMYDSGCRKCFPMMFSRFILRMIKDSFDVLCPLQSSPHILDVRLSFGRFHDVFIAGWTTFVVDDLVQFRLDDLCL